MVPPAIAFVCSRFAGAARLALIALLLAVAPAGAQEVGEETEPTAPAADAAAGSGPGGAEDPTQLEEFVVTAEKVEDLMTIRLESDQLLNVVGVEEFSKFAAGDVGEVLERVAGVNVVEGQFAIIRGLEDRYSSTTLNGAPVPSPDPNSQSVQLDLFPSEVVGNLAVAKSFSPELASNSSGGAINIVTHEYPADFEISLKAGTGFNEYAQDAFLEQRGHTDTSLIVNGLTPVGSRNGVPLFPTRKDLAAAGIHFVGGNPVGVPKSKNGNFFDDLEGVLDSDYVATLGGRRLFGGREFRLKGVLARETDYSTDEGTQENRVPAPPFYSAPRTIRIPRPPFFHVIPGELTESGDLSLGEISLSKGKYDLLFSEKTQQSTAFAGFGFDLDEEGSHKIDSSFFWTRVKQDLVEFEANGILPGVDYAAVADAQLAGTPPGSLFDPVASGSFIGDSLRVSAFGPLEDGALAFGTFNQSTAFETDRDFWVMQLGGDHRFAELPSLHVRWAVNRAKTAQQDSAVGLSYFFEPCGFSSLVPCDPGVDRIDAPAEYPTTVEALGPGQYVVRNDLLLSANRIREVSDFYGVDADYEFELAEASTLTLAGGVWVEGASRSVASGFLEGPSVSDAGENCFPGATSQFACLADTPFELGEAAFEEIAFANGNLGGIRTTSNDSSRAVDAWNLRGKLTLWDTLDLLGGVRGENLFIESLNDPFLVNPLTGELVTILGGPQTYPARFLFFDRLDNPFPGGPDGLSSPPPAGFVFNDMLLGMGITPGPCVGDNGTRPGLQCVDLLDAGDLQDLFNGRIDEQRILPSAGFTLQPLEGLVLRGAWSQTVARPSFRELGYYVTVEPGTNDLVVGNPRLGLSNVESYDARLEYTFGDRGDFFAVSYFTKTIANPIEALILRDPLNQELSATGLYQTFFNNPNEADLWGIELEARKNIDFLEDIGLSVPEWLQYFSIGGNYTYIQAEVGRTQDELERADRFFAVAPGDVERFAGLAPTRRLFNQPEWIANADVTFEHPDWGLELTVAYFAISDVLDAAGSATLSNTGTVLEYVPDRYVGAFSDLRATISKTVPLPGGLGDLVLRATGKNLLNGPRRLIYDPFQTNKEIVEQELRSGRDFSFSLTFRRTF